MISFTLTNCKPERSVFNKQNKISVKIVWNFRSCCSLFSQLPFFFFRSIKNHHIGLKHMFIMSLRAKFSLISLRSCRNYSCKHNGTKWSTGCEFNLPFAWWKSRRVLYKSISIQNTLSLTANFVNIQFTSLLFRFFGVILFFLSFFSTTPLLFWTTATQFLLWNSTDTAHNH